MIDICLDGEEAPPGDALVCDLANEIREVLTNGCKIDNNAVAIEVEARLGVIIDNGTHQRLELPTVSESIINPNVSSESFGFSFEAGVTSPQFNQVNQLIKDTLVSRLQTRKRKIGSSLQYTEPEKVYTIDQMHSTNEGLQRKYDLEPEAQMRVTFRKGSPPTFVEAISKKRLSLYNVHSGRITDAAVLLLDSDDDSVRTLDTRVAVNLEVTIPDSALLNYQRHYQEQQNVFERRRCRQSFKVGDFFKIETTTVNSVVPKDHAKGLGNQKTQKIKETFEVEVEINETRLKAEFYALQKNLPNHFYALISDFVDLVRDITHTLNHNPPSQPQHAESRKTVIDLRHWQQPKDHLVPYLEKVSPIIPILGDYLYHAVTPSLTNNLTEEEVVSAVMLDLTALEKRTLAQHEQSLAERKEVMEAHKLAPSFGGWRGGMNRRGGRGGHWRR